MLALGGALVALSAAPGAATSPPLPFDPTVPGPLLGEPAHAPMIGDPDRTRFPANPAFLEPVTLLDADDVEIPLEPHPSLPDAWVPTVPLTAGSYTYVTTTGTAAGTIESTGLVDDSPPDTPSIVTIERSTFSSSGGCARTEGHAYAEILSIEFASIADDATPASRMTLALYAGYSDAEVQSATAPLLIALEGATWYDYDVTVPAYTHFAVEAIDLAGNVSGRSATGEYVPAE